MNNKIKLIIFFLIVFNTSKGQPFRQLKEPGSNGAEYYGIVLPTAAASSLGKYTDIPVDLSTGIPNISIPLHNITDGNISLPISLSYHASGIKVSELSSWVGLGWSLNAGGIITRTVLDIKDDKNDLGTSHGYMYKGAELNNLTNSTIWQHDKEIDIFSFNFNGYSGKFIIDALGKPTVPYDFFNIV